MIVHAWPYLRGRSLEGHVRKVRLSVNAFLRERIRPGLLYQSSLRERRGDENLSLLGKGSIDLGKKVFKRLKTKRKMKEIFYSSLLRTLKGKGGHHHRRLEKDRFGGKGS